MTESSGLIESLTHKPYKYAVTGFESGMEACPLFTNRTKTWFGAKIVERRFKKQGLLARIYRLETEIAPGLNPYDEKFER